MTRVLGLTLIVLLAACGDDEGPEDPQYQGQWTGTYTNRSQPDVFFQAVLQLTQNDRSITGTLTTTTATPNASRSATVNGEVSGDQLEATFSFTDQCGGTASSTANLVDETNPPSLEGDYTSNDCLGDTSGEYSLVKNQ